MKAYEEDIKQEIIDEGCYQPNCQQRTWSIDRQILAKQNESVFRFFLQQKDVVSRNEINLYTMVHFFAEVGGYLGLLLGESLLSYFDVAWDGTGHLMSWIQKRI